jgi:hypothetical protein
VLIGVKYCGGCNPNYDRADFVAQLRTEFSDHVFVSPVETGVLYDFLIIVCGCDRRCAAIADLAARNGFIYVTSSASQSQVGRLLQNYHRK